MGQKSSKPSCSDSKNWKSDHSYFGANDSKSSNKTPLHLQSSENSQTLIESAYSKRQAKKPTKQKQHRMPNPGGSKTEYVAYVGDSVGHTTTTCYGG